MKRAMVIAAAAASLIGAPSAAESPLVSQAIQRGQVGERFDGYMGFVGQPSPEVRRQVSAINIQRRKLYTELSLRRKVTVELVGMATACQLFSHLSPGEAYMPNDGEWRRFNGQPVPLPDYCR